MRIGMTSVVFGAALALAGCFYYGDGVVINEPVAEQLYTDGDLEYAAKSGELKTEVFGNPFAIGGDRFTGLVTGHMKGANLGPVVTFTPKPTQPAPADYRVAMVFNAATGTAAADVCRDPASIPTGRETRSITLLSGFCIEDTLLATADGRATVSGPDDPRFRELVRRTTLSLFPAYDHHDIGGDPVIP